MHLFVDPPFKTESALVGEYALDEVLPFVSIDCPYDQLLSTAAAAIIISGEFLVIANIQYQPPGPVS